MGNPVAKVDHDEVLIAQLSHVIVVQYNNMERRSGA